jgi:predicted amidohydrolase
MLQYHFDAAIEIVSHDPCTVQYCLQVSFFERVNNAHFNSLAMVDADGSVLGVYRKSHIPDGPG